jgi:putative membrane protein
MTPKQPSAMDSNEWQRLSPVSIIYFIVKVTISSAKEWFLNSLPALAAFAVFVENKLFWSGIIGGILALLALVFGFLYYWHFRFQAKDGEILIQRGVIGKKRLNLQYARVQNVNIGTPFYFAHFKLVNCIFESAGSKASEVTLPGVREEFALSMRSKVFAAGKNVGMQDGDKPAGEADTSGPILALSNRESAKSGLTNYVAFIVLAAFAPFFNHIRNYYADNIFPMFMDNVEPIVGNPFVSGIVIGVASVLLVILVITSASVIGAFLRYYNFELYDSGDNIVRIAGLLERKSTTLTKSKVQAVLIKQNLVARILKRASLQYRQVGTGQDKRNDSSIQIPMLIPEDTRTYTSVAFVDCPEPEYANIHSSYVSRRFLYLGLLPFTVIASLSIFIPGTWFFLAPIALVPMFVILRMRYRQYGIWFNEEYGAIKQGLFGHSIMIFPLYKVQMVEVSQSRGQRRRNVGTLKVQLGSGSISIPYIPVELLDMFVNVALYKSESSTKSWM